MIISNHTDYNPEPLLRELVGDYDTSALTAELKYGRSRYGLSGDYRGLPPWIRVRLNPMNSYPFEWVFRTGGPRGHGQQLVGFRDAEELVAGIFLHEFGHHLDEVAGNRTRGMEGRADRFALDMMRKFSVGRMLSSSALSHFERERRGAPIGSLSKPLPEDG